MISLTKYEIYTELIILYSPEELNLNMEYFKPFLGLIKIHHDPVTRLLSIKIDNTLSNEIFGEVIRHILAHEEKCTGLTVRSYYNSMVRRRFPKQND